VTRLTLNPKNRSNHFVVNFDRFGMGAAFPGSLHSSGLFLALSFSCIELKKSRSGQSYANSISRERQKCGHC
jgi:hypothetical protein